MDSCTMSLGFERVIGQTYRQGLWNEFAGKSRIMQTILWTLKNDCWRMRKWLSWPTGAQPGPPCGR